MNKIIKILLSLMITLGFATTVNAASISNNITAYSSGTKYEYIEDLPIHQNNSGGYNLYILDKNTYFDSYTTLREPVEVDSGFAYIINNNNVTGSTTKNYYIAQVAILWYQDYLNGTDSNLTTEQKEYISSHTDDTICFYINKLVSDAKKYNNDSNIQIKDKNISFSKVDNYYYSNEIAVETKNLTSIPTIKYHGAPSNTQTIYNSLVANGEGTFQIRIPASSLYNIVEDDFELSISGYTNTSEIYAYSDYGIKKSIYGRTYTTSSNNVETSIPVTIKGVTATDVRIKVLNEDNNYISGIKFNIYSGDCSNSTCTSSNLINTFTTTSTYTSLNKVLETGTYTIVRKTNSIYDIPEKTVINVENKTSLQTFTIAEIVNDETTDDKENDNTYNFVIYNSLDDSNNIIYVYSSTGKLIKSYKSSYTSYSITLEEGNYYIFDSNEELIELHFKVTSDGKLMVKYIAEYEEQNSIDLDKMIKRYTNDTPIEDTPNDNDSSNNDGNINNNDNSSDIIIDNNTSNDTNSGTSTSTSTTIGGVTIENKVDVDVKVDWISNVIDCPITSLSSTIKYIFGAVILALGTYLVFRNVKKSKNSN